MVLLLLYWVIYCGRRENGYRRREDGRLETEDGRENIGVKFNLQHT